MELFGGNGNGGNGGGGLRDFLSRLAVVRAVQGGDVGLRDFHTVEDDGIIILREAELPIVANRHILLDGVGNGNRFPACFGFYIPFDEDGAGNETEVTDVDIAIFVGIDAIAKLLIFFRRLLRGVNGKVELQNGIIHSGVGHAIGFLNFDKVGKILAFAVSRIDIADGVLPGAALDEDGKDGIGFDCLKHFIAFGESGGIGNALAERIVGNAAGRILDAQAMDGHETAMLGIADNVDQGGDGGGVGEVRLVNNDLHLFGPFVRLFLYCLKRSIP